MITGTELLEALPVAVYMTDAEGHITFYNSAAADLWGHRPELGSSRWCGSWRLYRPDGRPLPHDECPMALALKERREVRGVEAIAEKPDGTRVRFLPYPTPLRDPSGRLVGAINLLMDITDRHDGTWNRRGWRPSLFHPTTPSSAKPSMLGIADDYDRLAQHPRRRAAKRSLSS